MTRHSKPDLVFILCDQLRADFLSVHGCAAIPTPHIDRLAREGLVFEQALSPYPLCVPARAALLTGLNPLQSGVVSNRHWLRPDRSALGLRTWPELLRERGYRTAAIGKMHFYPWESAEGFDDRIIAEDKRWPLVLDDYAEYLLRQGLRKSDPTHDTEYIAQFGAVTFPHGVELSVDRFVGRSAADYIAQQPTHRPLALMVGFPGPHCPYDPCQEYLDLVNPAALPPPRPRLDDGNPARTRFHRSFIEVHRQPWHNVDYTVFPVAAKRRIRHHYAALIRQIDDEVGRILAALESTGRLERSLVVFTSDHGDHLGDHDLVGKGTYYEPSIHIPLIARRPGAMDAGRRVRPPVQLQQVTATLLDVGGATLPDWWNYRPLFAHDRPWSEPTVPVPIFGLLDAGVMVRRGAWKLSRYSAGFTELFDIDEDPIEQRDRSNDPDCQQIRSELEGLLIDWMRESALAGHAEKRITMNPPGFASTSFGQRGWQRLYPAALANGSVS